MCYLPRLFILFVVFPHQLVGENIIVPRDAVCPIGAQLEASPDSYQARRYQGYGQHKAEQK